MRNIKPRLAWYKFYFHTNASNNKYGESIACFMKIKQIPGRIIFRAFNDNSNTCVSFKHIKHFEFDKSFVIETIYSNNGKLSSLLGWLKPEYNIDFFHIKSIFLQSIYSIWDGHKELSRRFSEANEGLGSLKCSIVFTFKKLQWIGRYIFVLPFSQWCVGHKELKR